MFPRYEMDMLPCVTKFLRNRSYRFQSTEVPFYEYRIDVMAYSKTENACVAVEMKLLKWRRALQQALIYQLCSEYSFVALPKKTIERVDLDLLKECGVGVIAVYPSGTCREFLSPRKSTELRNHYREMYIDSLCVNS